MTTVSYGRDTKRSVWKRPPRRDIARALAAWERVLGAAHVISDGALLADAQVATFATTNRIDALIRPASREQVQECVRIANAERVPIYPVSGGKNWGLGSRVPTRDGAVVMDLGRMARIVDFDEQLAYATVEPGVTFQQLYEFLQARGSKLMMNVVGSSPHASLIGNTVERGHGYGPYGDRFSHVCALEVVLPTGICIHTGFGRFPGAHATPLHRYGVGPLFDGMFTQSNLGIVTQLTTWLSPRPTHFEYAEFITESYDQLAPLIEALRPFRFDDRNDLQVRNHHKLPERWRYYVRKQSPNRKRRPPEGGWLGAAGLYSDSAAEAAGRRATLRRLLSGKVDYLRFYGRTLQKTAAMLEYPLSLVGMTMQLVADIPKSLWLGVPSDTPIRRAYAPKPKKKRPPADLHLDRDRVGLIWCCPTLPFTGQHVAAGVGIMEATAVAGGFVPAINLRPMSARTMDVVAGVAYDRDEVGADERAMACCDEMLRRLLAAGYPPYRVGIQSMDGLPEPGDDHGALMRSLKTALDPNDILSPGRYDFRASWP